ncbi:hypothetical protein EJ08DRAFT_13804 [Tothia fuscella]|uniref:Uncharacterized protein n=1 Tax=Tothia fuscella TaxID=1048955 RepID=A0A9P4U4L1_9PEZI|nr:hypothetical protein EJ08DRAFT_13804 [Tothia fuscella]
MYKITATPPSASSRDRKHDITTKMKLRARIVKRINQARLMPMRSSSKRPNTANYELFSNHDSICPAKPKKIWHHRILRHTTRNRNGINKIAGGKTFSKRLERVASTIFSDDTSRYLSGHLGSGRSSSFDSIGSMSTSNLCTSSTSSLTRSMTPSLSPRRREAFEIRRSTRIMHHTVVLTEQGRFGIRGALRYF